MQSESGDNKNVDNHNMSDQSQQDRDADLQNSRQDKLEGPIEDKQEQN